MSVTTPDLLDIGQDEIQGLAIAIAWIISEASEEAVCASWEHDCQHVIWERIHGGHGWAYDITDEQCAVLRYLSRECAGWVTWVEGDEGDSGVRHVSFKEWSEIHGRWLAARAKHGR